MNILVVYFVENDSIVLKEEISWSDHRSLQDLAELKNRLAVKFKKIKYFDDEGELISLINNKDFDIFRELVYEQRFANDEVILIVHNDILDCKKFGRSDQILKMKIESEYSNSFIHVKSISSAPKSAPNSAPNSGFIKHDADNDSMSSSSSSSIHIQKRKSYGERKKKIQSIPRYAAELRKEINYLTGSEVSDGQTILKRWRIKNVGSKKWKENSVKCVLLPSEFNNWISHCSLKVPTCFADQKIDAEMEIGIHGIWDTCLDQESQDLNLTWLLFKDGLITKSCVNFKDYILTCLELRIKVKKRTHETEFQTNAIKKHLSESSIERVDQDFSILNISEEDKCEEKEQCEKELTVSEIENKLMRNDSDIFDIDLPECPHVDDFQITDFNKPGNFISTEIIKEEKKPYFETEDHSILSLLKQSNYVGKEISTMDATITSADIERCIAENLIGMKVKHGNFERISTSEDIELTAKVVDHETLPEDHEGPVASGYENANIEDKSDDLKVSKCEKYSEEDAFIECDIIMESEVTLTEKEETTLEEDINITKEVEGSFVNVEVNLKNDFKGDKNIVSENEMDKDVEDDNTQCIDKEATNNSVDQTFSDKAFVSRLKPIDVIRNEFPRSNEVSVASSEYLQYPHGNQSKNYVAGRGLDNVLYPQQQQQPHIDYQRSGGAVYGLPYNTSTGNVPPPYVYTPGNPLSSGYTPGNPLSSAYTPGINTTTAYVPGNVYPNLNVSPFMQVHQNNDNIVENLRRGGHLHEHINEAPTMQRVENGQFYVTSVNIEKLKGMGFIDEERNRRLLMKFNNNINDVISDLID